MCPGKSRRRGSDAEPQDAFAAKFTARALSGASNFRQQQKLRKKLAKKAAEEDAEDENYRRTRRKRFTDPDTPFGKRSLVYRLKYGDLKDKAKSLDIEDPVKPRPLREAKRDSAYLERGFRDREPDASRVEPRRTERWADKREGESKRTDRWGDREGGSRRTDRWGDREEGSGRTDRWGNKDGESRRNDRWSNKEGKSKRTDLWNDREGSGLSERWCNNEGDSRRTDRWGDRDESRRNERSENSEGRNGPQRKRSMMPMTVKYTTAASQFLYGRNVVKSALEQGRRKLYNLYIYGGDNRRDSKDDTTMSRLAKKHGIPVTIVPNEEQRIMDKMSMGRPHNGFVLEASPLPQRPIRSLGRLEETPTRMGFHVELDYQTKEEESINGTDTFIKRANDSMPKPFVLLLNEIMDPGNLGGILRTASYLGIDAVGITNRGSSTLTPVVLKSAAGAVEEITLFTVDNAVTFVEESTRAGWKSFAAVAPPDRKLVRKHGEKFISTDEVQAKSPLNEHPCLLILGNEGHGLPKPIKVAADYELSVPNFVRGSNVDSLNVSVAAGLLCHSFVKEIKAFEEKAQDQVHEMKNLVRRLERRKNRELAGAEEVEVEKQAKEAEEVKEVKEAKEASNEGSKTEEQNVEEQKVEQKKAEEAELGF